MKKEKKHEGQKPEGEKHAKETTANPEAQADATQQTEEQSPEPQQEDNAAAAELAEMKDKYLRLAAEFDNFRRRTAKERIELMKTANEDLMVALLPVLDDLERARQAMESSQEIEPVKEGVELVFHKLLYTLTNKGLVALDAKGQEFDTEKHEAITQIPAPSPELKGKVVDQVEKGYKLHDKVIRFAKVVTGA